MTPSKEPLLDMANRVASLPWAMHQSLEGEARKPETKIGGFTERQWIAMGCDPLATALLFHDRSNRSGGLVAVPTEQALDMMHRAICHRPLRERVRAALLEDWPVSGVERLEAAVERVCRAVEGE